VEIYEDFIAKGIPGTEGVLIAALNKSGNLKMADDFLNCGNWGLEQAAREWAARNGYSVGSKSGGPPNKWGFGR